MSDSNPRIRRGAHRPRHDPLRGLPALLVVLAALALLFTGMTLWRPGGTANPSSQPPGTPSAPPLSEELAAVRRTSPSRSPSASPRPSVRISPSRAVSPSMAASPSPSPAATATATETPKPSTTPVPPRTAELPVVVLNATRKAGLAARVATSLERRGWRVDGAGNFRGNLSATTVYYPAGHAGAARALAADLPGTVRVRQLSGEVSGLSSRRLTLVLTSDYPG